MPKFSVIIPVYNVALYLRECLDSVLAQTFTDWEAICVDDGSTDGSGAILDKYAAQDNRFCVIHQKNAGVSAARNAALDVARGEWIAYLDADDFWADSILADLNEKIAVNPSVEMITYTPLIPVNTNGEKVEWKGHRVEPGLLCGADVLRGICGKYDELGWHSCDKIYRREWHERIGLRFNLKVYAGEDALYSNTAFANTKHVLVCDDVSGYYRRINPESATHNFTLRMWLSQIERFASLLDVWKQTGNDAVLVALRHDVDGVFRIGCANGGEYRSACVDSMVSSDDFNKIVVEFAKVHCRGRTRLFAIVFSVMPEKMKRFFLGLMR